VGECSTPCEAHQCEELANDICVAHFICTQKQNAERRVRPCRRRATRAIAVTVYHDGNPVQVDASGLDLTHALRRDERTADRERSHSAGFDARIW